MDFSGILQTAAKACAEAQDADTHIGEDGLIHCNRCGGSRQFVRDFSKTPGFEDIGIFKVPCACECMKARFAEEERLEEQRKKADEVAKLRKAGFPDAEMARYTFEADDKKYGQISQAMRIYCDHFKDLRKDGKGLLLYGDVGTGKTFYAACIVNDLISRGYPCLMTTFSRLINRMQESWEGRQDFVDGLAEYALIAIDDLGVERDTAYMNENVTTIIDALYRNKVPMVITSNYAPSDMVNAADIRRGRIYDRLLERCHPVRVSGESRRKAMGRSDYSDMKKLLGV